jgi:hypothetical protein
VAKAPLVSKLTGWIPGQTAAVDSDQIIARSPFDGTVTKCALIAEAAVTGATATKRTFQLINKGQAGAGAVVVGTLDLITAVNLVAFDETLFTLAGGAAVNVAEGDILAVVETHASTGTAHSGGEVIIEISRL